jgi:hypothetical protein
MSTIFLLAGVVLAGTIIAAAVQVRSLQLRIGAGVGNWGPGRPLASWVILRACPESLKGSAEGSPWPRQSASQQRFLGGPRNDTVSPSQGAK